MSSNNSDKNIAFIGTSKNMTMFSLNTYKGRKLFDIRKCYSNSQNEIVHTKKGISLTESNFNDVLKVITDNKDDIKEWFSSNTSNKDALNSLADSVTNIRENSLKKQDYEAQDKHFRSPLFFEVQAQPDGKKLILNKNHPFHKSINELTDSEHTLIYNLLISIDQAFSMYDEQKISADDLIDDIKITWSHILSNYCQSNE